VSILLIDVLFDRATKVAEPVRVREPRRAQPEDTTRVGQLPRGRVKAVSVLFSTHPHFVAHDTGKMHPERPARMQAVYDGVAESGVADALIRFEPRRATALEVARVHPEPFLERLEAFTSAGGGKIEADTVVVEASYEAALLAAGAGLESVERLDAGEGDVAFCAVRPPGHHATSTRSMGFCLLNNVAITAKMLADRGERVMIVDYDAHHGNGTQDIFYEDANVVYVSFHEYPLYPGTGALADMGRRDGYGATINFPLPSGATGDVFRLGIDEVLVPFSESFDPTWLLVSAGYDAHRRDPITGLGLSSGDYADLTTQLSRLVKPGHQVVFLEGGYDLEAVTTSSAATLAALCGENHRPEAPTSGGPGRSVVEAVQMRRSEAGFSA